MTDRTPLSRDIPPEAGNRAKIDRASGEVRGSGSGAGGGNPGEDYDDDSAAGSATVPTGKNSA